MQYWNGVLNEITTCKGTTRGFLLSHDDAALERSRQKEKRDLRIFPLGKDYPGKHLTKREAEAMFWIVQDLTISQAACHMKLSPRTVEFYLKNLKSKLGCPSKKDLIEKILQTNLLQQLEKEGMCIVKH